MAETSKNKIYYNDDENSVADVLMDIKKLAQSTDDAIEKSKYDDTSIEQDITEIKAEQEVQNNNIELNKNNMEQYVAELEAENSRLREDLNGLPKGQASGESIDLSDSAEMRCELKISGNSKQETRSGKNKLKIADGIYTLGGITAIAKDGKIKVSGAATSTSIIQIPIENIVINETYTLSANGDNTSGLVSDNLIRFANTSGGAINGTYLDLNKESITFTLSNVTLAKLDIRTVNGTTVNYTIKPQLELGSEKTDYEQYGASPSPDYLSENESCGDNINILDWNNCTSGIFWDLNNGGSKGTASNAWAVNDYQKVKNNHIAFSTTLKLSSGTTYGRVLYYDENKTLISNVAVNSFPSILAVPSNAKYYTYFFLLQYLPMNCELKLEEGEIVTPYSPPGQGCINEVMCNKNLFDKNLFNDFTGTNQYLDLQLKPNTTYIMSSNLPVASGIGANLFFINEGENISLTVNPVTPNKPRKLTTKNSGKVRIAYRDYLNELSKEKTQYWYQIEEGTTVTDCVEHKEQNYIIPTQKPFGAVGNIRDTFIKKDGKRYEHHPINRYYFTGNENISIPSSPNEYGIYNANCVAVSCINFIGKSNYYKNQTNFIAQTTEEGVFIYNNAIYIRTKKTNANDLKTYLSEQYNAGTPVYVDYVLSKPLDIECTEEQNKILDKIEKEAKTYDKVTHMYSTDKISSYKEVTYKKDIETLFNNTLVEGV